MPLGGLKVGYLLAPGVFIGKSSRYSVSRSFPMLEDSTFYSTFMCFDIRTSQSERLTTSVMNGSLRLTLNIPSADKVHLQLVDNI